MSDIVLFGNMRCSLTLARGLARAGHRIHAGFDEHDPYLTESRYVVGSFNHPPPDSRPEAALGALAGYLERHPEIDTVIPVSDIATRLLSREASERGGVQVIVARRDLVETCIDKAAMFDLCQELNIPLAPLRIVTSYAELLDAVSSIGVPCVVKPVDASHYLFERKAVILRRVEDAQAAIPSWPDEHPNLCVQAFIDGPRYDISFAAREGRLIGAVACEVSRTDRQDGTGYTTRLTSRRPDPKIAQGVETIVRALNYTGVGDIEFMVDRTSGLITFLELNPRLSASYRSAEVCGLPLSTLMLALGRGERIEPRPDPWAYPTGRTIVWTKGELAGVKRQRRAGEITPPQSLRLTAQVLAAAASRHHLTFDPSDIAPTTWLYLHPLLRRLGARLRAAPASP